MVKHTSTQTSLLLAGLLTVAWHNWRLWQRDTALATRLQAERTATPPLRQVPNVSVLVAAWNEAAHIDAHIRSFHALGYPNIELILCAGGNDDTFQRAQRYQSAQVTVLEQHAGEGKQIALARCLEHATGDILYLIDADCVYQDEALLRLLAPLINDGEHAATGGSRPLDAQMKKLLPVYVWASDVAAAARTPAYTHGLLGRNAALTRHAIDQIGGLDFVARTGTDYQLAQRLIRAGIAIRFVGASVVPTNYPQTLGVYQRKQSRWLRTTLIHGWRYGATDDVRRTLHTAASGLGMVLAPLLAPLFGWFALACWLLLVAHAASSKLRYALFASRLHGYLLPARLFAAIVPLTLVDFAIWAWPLAAVIDPRRREQW